MSLLDLNGRQDEPAVLALLRQGHGTEAALQHVRVHYRSGEWPFIGWQEGAVLVACAGAEQHPNATIGISSLVVAPDWRHRGLARGLIEALAERMAARQVVAETDDDAVDFYRRCGFSVENAPSKFGRPRYWCVYVYRLS